MSKPLDEVLAEPDDAALCGCMFELILRHHGDDVVAAELPEAERVVLLVCNVSAIISNGGFRYLFEKDIDGDPYYARCADAYQVIGCEVAAQAFRETLALFPNERPPREAGKRMRYYLTNIKDWPTPQDDRFFTTDKDRNRCLAAYIRTHARAYRHLDGPPKPQPEPTERDGARELTRRDVVEMLPLASLPHWKRVAFAARCARRVQPLFEKYWPLAPAKYGNAVRQAIDLTEQSVADASPAPGLHDAVVQAAVTVGAAFAFLPGVFDEEPRPRNAHEGGIASFAAKAAQRAAEAAEANPEESAHKAFEAWNFARAAAGNAGQTEIAEQLDLVLAQLRPVADDSSNLERSTEDAALYERGRYLFLLFTLPEVLRMLLRIGTDLAGLGEFGWWRSLLLPCGALVGAYYLWKGERWLTWLLPLAMVASGGVNLVLFVARAARTFPKVPAERAGLMFQMFALPLAALLVLMLFELIGGLVFLLSPSVRAFFKMQREAEEEMF